MNNSITSLERIGIALNQREPDRVPLCLALTYHGAIELGMSLKRYYSSAENIVKGQLRLREKFSNDCLNAFYYAALDYEAFGGKMVFREDGPVTSGEPVIKSDEDILKLSVPSVYVSEGMKMCLKSIELLRASVGPGVAIPATVMSPFSLPILQMGFDKYIELIYEKPALFNRLMSVNEEFCVNWAKAQISAGASFVGYIDSMAAPEIIPIDLYRKMGYEINKRTLKRIGGDVSVLLSSQNCIPIMDELVSIGSKMVYVGCREDIGEAKIKADKRIAIGGNLNGIEMCRWREKETIDKVKNIIKKAGRGGGLVISDSAGDIPIYVGGNIIECIVDTVNEWGRYPLTWTNEYD